MVLKVFGAANTACPQRVLACFIEKGVDFELIHVDLNRGDHKSPDFLLRQNLKSPSSTTGTCPKGSNTENLN
ncbi:hypothetical protein K1719_045587 [Acacia pycnantha]|nr:hypothetical protein K1719_045587 [Acacia pycnantha]